MAVQTLRYRADLPFDRVRVVLARVRRARLRLLAALSDSLLLSAALGIVLALAANGADRTITAVPLLAVLVSATVAQCGAGWRLGLYKGRYQVGSFDEIPVLAGAVVVAGGIAALVAEVGFDTPTALAVLMGAPVALVGQGATRCAVRVMRERKLSPSASAKHRVVVVGAGEAGYELVHALKRDPTSEYVVVALVDDDPFKRDMRILGVAVAGAVSDLRRVAERYDATVVVVAVPSDVTETVLHRVRDAAAPLGLQVKVLPSLGELVRGEATPRDLRNMSARELLGRREVGIDAASVAAVIEGKTVLVTGAGGSIGSELCLQLAQWRPERLVMLDRDESALHAVQLSLRGRALLDDDSLVVADIRDHKRVDEVFRTVRPDVVFHTAALKHLPLLERYPAEAVKTNVHGTEHVLYAALRYGTKRLVNISTDKAANPCSVLGWSKRIGERLTATAAEATGLPYVSVRFGNVLGSRGSVLTAFQSQIEAGRPLTVTHPDVTRYFMTVEEAVTLLVQAAAVGRPGEVLVLDMGEPVRIADVAKRLLRLANRPIDIEYTGLRPGEKLHEVLLDDTESHERPFHPLITHAKVPSLPASALSLLPPDGDAERTAHALRAVSELDAPTFDIDLRPEAVAATAP